MAKYHVNRENGFTVVDANRHATDTLGKLVLYSSQMQAIEDAPGVTRVVPFEVVVAMFSDWTYFTVEY